MKDWIIYGIIAAFLMASRDYFTSNYTSGYTVTEHILYYYVLCAIFISAYVCYRRFNHGEKIKLISKNDLWKYALVAISSVLIITPCEVLSIRNSTNPGKARALTNMNAIILILVSMYVFKTEKVTPTKVVGLLFFGLGMFLVF
jgi:drug/metabolite transporter (DMT)-like permease